MRRALAALALVLSGCATADPPPPPPGRLIPAADGFDVGDTGLQIGFGRAQDGAIDAASRLMGHASTGETRFPDCTRITWPDGLAMDFRGGAFAGWVDPRGRSGLAAAGRTCG